MTTECSGVAGTLLGHAFESQFDEFPPTQPITTDDIPAPFIEEVLQAMTRRAYVCSVCRRCGATSRRDA